MANQFTVNPLGGFNLGGAVAGLGQQFGDRMRADDQQQQQQDTQAFMRQAMDGDPTALKELFVRDPRMAQFVEQRNAQKLATLGAEQAQASKKAEVDWGMKWKQAQGEEQKQALLQEALTNPLIDIDESDVGIGGPQADLGVNTMLYSHMGDKAYNQFFGGNQPDIKTETIQTPTGAIVINKQTGETLKEVGIPEKRAEFEANKKERSRKIAEQKRKELAQIETAKIKKLDAADARADALDTTKRAFALTKELGSVDAIAPVTGWFDRVTPTGNKSQDVINKALELKDLLTLNNLGLMSGVLTDRDIAILARAGSGLNVDEDGFLGSETGVVNQIKKVESMLDQKLKKAVDRGDLSKLDYESMKDDSPVAKQADGKIMVDANGNRAMVYSDGSYKAL